MDKSGHNMTVLGKIADQRTTLTILRVLLRNQVSTQTPTLRLHCTTPNQSPETRLENTSDHPKRTTLKGPEPPPDPHKIHPKTPIHEETESLTLPKTTRETSLKPHGPKPRQTNTETSPKTTPEKPKRSGYRCDVPATPSKSSRRNFASNVWCST